MQQRIIGFHRDEEDHWVAELECGHFQHTRHDPPWISRPWVVTPEGRQSMLGQVLKCKKCDEGAPPDKSWRCGVICNMAGGCPEPSSRPDCRQTQNQDLILW